MADGWAAGQTGCWWDWLLCWRGWGSECSVQLGRSLKQVASWGVLYCSHLHRHLQASSSDFRLSCPPPNFQPLWVLPPAMQTYTSSLDNVDVANNILYIKAQKAAVSLWKQERLGMSDRH